MDNPTESKLKISSKDRKCTFQVPDGCLVNDQSFDIQEAVDNSAVVQTEIETARRLSKKRKITASKLAVTKRLLAEYEEKQKADTMKKVAVELAKSNEQQRKDTEKEQEQIVKMRAAMGLGPESDDSDSDIELLGGTFSNDGDAEVKKESTE